MATRTFCPASTGARSGRWLNSEYNHIFLRRMTVNRPVIHNGTQMSRCPAEFELICCLQKRICMKYLISFVIILGLTAQSGKLFSLQMFLSG